MDSGDGTIRQRTNSQMEDALTTSMSRVPEKQDADAGLVERYLSGDMTAFDELMIRYERQIYRDC